MPMNYEYSFEIKPGRFVYLPTATARRRGAEICEGVLKRWTPHRIFFHLARRGGHIAAMRLHKRSSLFARLDIADFFGSVTRTKIARTLRSIGFGRRVAFNIAYESVVQRDGRRFLPYGFVQSMALATLVLEKSALGSTLIEIHDSGIIVSIYVDDITISANLTEPLEEAILEIKNSAEISNFDLAPHKEERIGVKAHPFNCILSKENILVQSNRIEKFRTEFNGASEFGQAAIYKYINAINEEQAEEFLASVGL